MELFVDKYFIAKHFLVSFTSTTTKVHKIVNTILRTLNNNNNVTKYVTHIEKLNLITLNIINHYEVFMMSSINGYLRHLIIGEHISTRLMAEY